MESIQAICRLAGRGGSCPPDAAPPGSAMETMVTLTDNLAAHPVAGARQVALVSSNAILAEGLRGILSREPRLKFYPCIIDPPGLRSFLGKFANALLLVDMHLPFEVWRHALNANFNPRGNRVVLLVPTATTADRISREMGERAQVLRADLGADSLLDELQRIAGIHPLPRPVAEERATPVKTILSPREIEILRQTALGKYNKEISDELGITIDTVKFHLKNLQLKLGVSNRMSAVLKAIRIHIIEMPAGPD